MSRAIKILSQFKESKSDAIEELIDIMTNSLEHFNSEKEAIDHIVKETKLNKDQVTKFYKEENAAFFRGSYDFKKPADLVKLFSKYFK